MSLSACTDVAAADWIVGLEKRWPQLTVMGPPGFPAYARLRFLPDPAFEGQNESAANYPEDALPEDEQLAVVLEILSRYTSAPADCYFCVWEGWGISVVGDGVPTVKLPTRSYLLFHGAPTDCGDWGPDVQFDPRGPDAADPAFVWPADHAWCVTHDVDPHFAMIAGPAEAIELIIADSRLDAVTHDPEENPPFYS